MELSPANSWLVVWVRLGADFYFAEAGAFASGFKTR